MTAAYSSQSRQHCDASAQEGEVEYVTKSEMNEVLTVCENAVREGILMEVGNSFFSLFIDRVVKLGEETKMEAFIAVMKAKSSMLCINQSVKVLMYLLWII